MMESDLEPDFLISLAARRLVDVPREQRGSAAVPWLRAQFPLTAVQAVQSLRLANLIKSGGLDDGAS